MLGLVAQQFKLVHQQLVLADVHSFLMNQMAHNIVHQKTCQLNPPIIGKLVRKNLHNIRLSPIQLDQRKGQPLGPEVNHPHNLSLVHSQFPNFQVMRCNAHIGVHQFAFLDAIEGQALGERVSVGVEFAFENGSD